MFNIHHFITIRRVENFYVSILYYFVGSFLPIEWCFCFSEMFPFVIVFLINLELQIDSKYLSIYGILHDVSLNYINSEIFQSFLNTLLQNQYVTVGLQFRFDLMQWRNDLVLLPSFRNNIPLNVECCGVKTRLAEWIFCLFSNKYPFLCQHICVVVIASFWVLVLYWFSIKEVIFIKIQIVFVQLNFKLTTCNASNRKNLFNGAVQEFI